MSGPLAGLRVIDFGQYVAGPLVAVMLADQGAEVIRVDPPSGPRFDRPADAFLNRGKKRVSLDLKTTSDLVAAQKLATTADVVVENFRPGVMERLGLGATSMTASNPRLIYCSLPGFASGDPRSDMSAWEGILHAATANTIPRAGEEPPGWDWSRPTYSALPLPSSFAAYLGATSIVMALIARERTGRGQRVEVPLFDAMFTLIGRNGAYRDVDGGPRLPAPIHGRGSGSFPCKDGHYVQFDALIPRHLAWFARAAGVTADWGPKLLDPTSNADPSINEELHARLRELFLTRTASEWEELGNTAGAVIGVVRTPQEWIATEHARRIRAVTQVDDPIFGPTWTAGLPVYLSRTAADSPVARRLPGSDTKEVLDELENLEPPKIATGAELDLKHPLSGFQVIDLGVALAGPTTGRLLHEFGADVIKIGPPNSGPGGYLNRGKRSLLLDISGTAGQAIYWKLVEGADVIIENFSPSTADRLGIGYEEVRSRRPDIVYTSISCYGLGGPWTNRRGWEREGQAVTGIMERTTLPSVIGPYNPVDIGTGILGAFATGLALFHRVRTGEGQMAGASLAQTATYHQALFMLDFKGYRPTEPRGYEALGESALNRFYSASDKWFYLVAEDAEIKALGEVVEADLSDLAPTTLEDVLEKAFLSRSAEEWVALLQSRGLAAHENVAIEDLMEQQAVRDRGLSITLDVEDVGPCTMPGVSVHFSDTPAQVGAPPARTGSDALAILTEIGMADRLESLNDRWVLRSKNLPAAWSTSD